MCLQGEVVQLDIQKACLPRVNTAGFENAGFLLRIPLNLVLSINCQGILTAQGTESECMSVKSLHERK